jgi:hypothetical protein
MLRDPVLLKNAESEISRLPSALSRAEQRVLTDLLPALIAPALGSLQLAAETAAHEPIGALAHLVVARAAISRALRAALRQYRPRQ